MQFSNKLKNVSYFLSLSRGDFTTAESWNFSGVTNFQGAFGVANLTNLKTNNWNMREVTNYDLAFTNLTCTTCNFSGIHVTNKALTTVAMFEDYNGPTVTVFPEFDMSEVQDSSSMFRSMDLNLFAQKNLILISSKNKKVTSMFEETENVQLDTLSWNTSNVESYERFFYTLFSNGDLTSLDMSGIVVSSKATNLKAMFHGATNITLDTTSWNTSGVVDFTDIFMKVNNMTNVDTSGVRVGAVATNITGMFSNVNHLTLNTNLPGREWNTSSVINMDFLFSYARCTDSSACDFSRFIPTAQTTSMMNTFSGLNHQIINGVEGTSWSDDSNFPVVNTALWNTTHVENFTGVFSRRDMTGSNLSGLSVTSRAKNLNRMFNGSSNLILDTTAWDMSGVENADEIFTQMEASGINFSGFRPQGNISLKNAFNGVKNAVVKTSSWNLTSGADVQEIFYNGYNTKLHVDLNLAALTNGSSAFNHYMISNDMYVLIEAGATDPGPPSGAHYLTGANVWCPNYAGTTFMGISCQKDPFPYP